MTDLGLYAKNDQLNHIQFSRFSIGHWSLTTNTPPLSRISEFG